MSGNVPAVRFAGFTEPWEQRKLGELFVESDERSSELEILSVSVANGIYPASQSDRDTNPGASLANYKVVRPGDVVYNSMRMWQGAVDSSLYEGIVSPAYVVARPTENVIPRFCARLLRRPELLVQYQRASQGNSKDTQVLKFEEFANIAVHVPHDGDEQIVIGEMFDELDNLITLHQRKQGNVWHRNGAWNGLTNSLVFRTPLAASSPSCTPTVARMDASDGADRVAAGSVPMAQTCVCASGDASAAEPSERPFALRGMPRAPGGDRLEP